MNTQRTFLEKSPLQSQKTLKNYSVFGSKSVAYNATAHSAPAQKEITPKMNKLSLGVISFWGLLPLVLWLRCNLKQNNTHSVKFLCFFPYKERRRKESRENKTGGNCHPFIL